MGKRAVPIFLVLHGAALIFLSRAIPLELGDGLAALGNALLSSGAAPAGLRFDCTRPPLGWLILTPLVSWAFRSGGVERVLEACHVLMPLFLTSLLWACHRFFASLYSPRAGFLALLAMAMSPILIHFAPLALFDIFAALAALPFFWASYRYLAAPGPKPLALTAGAYVLAVLSRYHLGLLILVPLAYKLCEPDRGSWAPRLRGFLLSPLWLFPPLAYLALVGLEGLLLWIHDGGELWGAVRRAHTALSSYSTHAVFRMNYPWSVYLASLKNELGAGAAALVLLGLSAWLWRRRPLDIFLALALLLPLALLSFCVGVKERRYMILIFPALFAAFAQGVDSLVSWSKAPRLAREALLLAAFAMYPWSGTLASAHYIWEAPALHSRMPLRLGELVRAQTPPSACVAWARGDIHLEGPDDPIAYERMAVLSGRLFPFYASRQVREQDQRAPHPDCPWLVVPREGPRGPRWESEALAKVYRASEDPRWPEWEVFTDDIRPARRWPR